MSASARVHEELAGELAVDPATGRPAGRPQAIVLLLSSCLSVLGAVLLAPVLPRIQVAFAETPGVATLTPIVLTAPALFIGLTAVVAGRIVDESKGAKKRLPGFGHRVHSVIDPRVAVLFTLARDSGLEGDGKGGFWCGGENGKLRHVSRAQKPREKTPRTV